MSKAYGSMTSEELLTLKEDLEKRYGAEKALGLKLDMSRGKPGPDQLALSLPMFGGLMPDSDFSTESGVDCRNYGALEGIPECRELFSRIVQVSPDQILVGGNSSLNLMYDAIARAMTNGVLGGEKPWAFVEGRKFLCPSPGYDRHFAITEFFGFDLVTIPMTPTGPDMDMVEDYVNNDPLVKGIWCVPKYSNPQGITYSDDTVRRFAGLKPAAPDFRIFWDDAYAVHDVYDDHPDHLISLMTECRKLGSENMCYIFGSTSKITFPSSGVAVFASSADNIKFVKKQMAVQTIGPDKINQLRHYRYFRDIDGIHAHMKKQAAVLRPRFDTVLSKLDSELSGLGIADWNKPSGGYFVAVRLTNGTAKRTVALCKEAGVALTPAGAVFPYGKDPDDSWIRIAPTFPSVDELSKAMDLFCLCAKLAAIDKLLGE